MPKMALLLATDSWEKMEIFQRLLADTPKAVWRNRSKLTPEYLDRIPFPLNLYFFHRNVIRYRAICTSIARGEARDWPLWMTPPEFRDATDPFSMFVEICRLDQIEDTPIECFPKWDHP